MRWASARAKMSAVPPGGAGTMILIGLLGKVWAKALKALKVQKLQKHALLARRRSQRLKVKKSQRQHVRKRAKNNILAQSIAWRLSQVRQPLLFVVI